jgi:hypothetical protein
MRLPPRFFEPQTWATQDEHKATKQKEKRKTDFLSTLLEFMVRMKF